MNTFEQVDKKLADVYKEGYQAGTKAERDQICAELTKVLNTIPLGGFAMTCALESLREKYSVGESL